MLKFLNLGSKATTPDQATRAAQERIKLWVREIMQLAPDTELRVYELRCPDADCPDVETVIAIFAASGGRTFKLMQSLTTVTRAAIERLTTSPNPTLQ